MKQLARILMLTAFLAACGGSNTPAATQTQALPSETATATATAAPTQTPAPTETIIPTITPIPEVRFAVIGDYGHDGKNLAAVAALIDSWNVDLVLTVGDNNYPDGEAETIDLNIGQYFHQYIFPYTGDFGDGADTNRFFPVLGNHDWNTKPPQPYIDYFTLPGNEYYYTFSWEFIDFFAIDSDSRQPDGIGQSSVQGQWLKTALANSTAPWKIVYMHLPPYASSLREPHLAVRWPFEEWGADIVLSGHDHVYERLEVDGFPYIINGLGGKSRYFFGETHPGSQKRYREDYGAMLVIASPTEIVFAFITVDGETIDTFVLSRE